jgi:predicted acetyltransferase
VSVEIRAAGPDEALAALRPIWLYFGNEPQEDRAQRVLRLLAPGRLHAAFDGGEAVGGAGAFSLELTVPGGRLPAAGVTVVGVMPTHRRRGVLTAMTRAQLDDVRSRGELLAALWASEGAIYGRFGYGMASLCGEIDLGTAYARFRVPVAWEGQARLVTPGEALEGVSGVYERVAASTPGMYRRSREWWESRVLDDPEWRRFGGGELVCALLEGGGEAEAYALYRIHFSFADGSSTAALTVVEAMGATPEATAAVWRYLLDVDWMERVKATLLPVDHPLFLLLVDPRRMRFRVDDALWVRLVDVEAALAGRSYRGEENVVLDVADAFCPWNEDRYHVGPRGVGRTEEPAELRLAVDALASVYLGGFTFAQLARGGLVEEPVPGAIERADALFRTDVAPWCPEIF